MKNEFPLVSIIVPVYNVETYIADCVNSILKQTYSHFELILIDDGSEDASGIICDDFSCKDKRIRTVHVQNGGVSAARNKGLDICLGEYIAFVDADDVIHPQYLEFLLKTLEDNRSDISYCGVQYTKNVGAFENLDYKEQEVRRFSDPLGFYFDAWILPNVFNKLFKKSIIGEIRFAEIKRAEDLLFTVQVLKRCQSAAGIKKCVLYDYRQRPGSCMGDFNLATLVDLDARLDAFSVIDEKFETTRCKMSNQTFRFYLDFTLKSLNSEEYAVKKKLKEQGRKLAENMWSVCGDIPKWEQQVICLSPRLWIYIRLVQHKLFGKQLYVA